MNVIFNDSVLLNYRCLSFICRFLCSGKNCKRRGTSESLTGGSKTKLEIMKLSWVTGYQFKDLQLPKLCDFTIQKPTQMSFQICLTLLVLTLIKQLQW